MAEPGSTHSAHFSVPEADLNSFLRSRSLDNRSGLPMHVCSLLLRYLLPQLEVERYVTHRRVPLERFQELSSSDLYGRQSVIHITGSSVEGLSVPPYRERTLPKVPNDVPGHIGAPFFQASDVDVMCEVRFLPVEVRPSSGQLYIDEKRASHPGYVRVVLDNPTDTYGLSFSVRDICREVEENGRFVYYLSNEEFTKRLGRVARDNARHHDHKVNLSGPAVNIEPKYSEQQGALDLIPDIDLVTALPLLGHPAAFHQWLERVSQQDLYWPSREHVEDIRLHGKCFVVTTGHISSKDRNLECRLSFSDPEKRLAQTLTPIQRKIYLLMKLLQKCFLQEPKVLVTYHLKTLMFWLLEASQSNDWTEHMVFAQVLRFLDRIIECLAQQNIPSYFYPKNNLISHSKSEHVTVTLAAVQRIREDPLHHLYGIDERIWMGFSTLVPLSTLHRASVQAVNSPAENFRMKMANGLMQQARRGTIRNILWPLRCADLMRDTFCILRDVINTHLGSGARPAPAAWTPQDWLMVAALAVFSAVQQEEDRWIHSVQCDFNATATGMSVEGSDTFIEAADTLLSGRPHAAFMIKMFLAAGGANFPPLDPCITLRYYLMVGKERLALESRPVRAHIISQSVIQSGEMNNLHAVFGAEKTRNCASDYDASSFPRSTEAQETRNSSTGTVRREKLDGARPKNFNHREHVPETAAAPSASDLPKLTTEVILPAAELQKYAIASAPAQGGASELTMDRMAGDLLFRETYGLCPALIVDLHVALLTIVGHLLRHQPRLACRCALWIHRLTANFGGWGPEAAPSVPLSAAPLFLESLPPCSASLLRRPYARAALLPLSAMLVFVTVTLTDEPFRQQVAMVRVTEETLAAFFDVQLKAAGRNDSHHGEVEWTSAVMKLCLREMMGQDVAACLREVGLVSGVNKGKIARQIMMNHGL